SGARLARLARPALGSGTRRRAAPDGGADRVRLPRGALGLPRRSGEREREREVIATDCDLEGAKHPWVRAHQPQATHCECADERREQQGSLDQRLASRRPHHGEPSTWFTNTADPAPSSSACSAMDTVPLLLVKRRSPFSG